MESRIPGFKSYLFAVWKRADTCPLWDPISLSNLGDTCFTGLVWRFYGLWVPVRFTYSRHEIKVNLLYDFLLKISVLGILKIIIIFIFAYDTSKTLWSSVCLW